MPLHNPLGVTERILNFGGPGAGKSHNLLRIAQFAQDTGSPAHFHIVDTDNAMSRMLATDFTMLTNTTVYECYEWPDLTAVMRDVAPKLTPIDWLGIDLLDPTWPMAQEYFTEKVFGGGIDDFFLQARAHQEASNAKGSASPFDGWKDWTVINKLYGSFQNQILRCPGNVYATAAADAVNLDTDSKDVRNLFASLGFKPRGQKHTAHKFHTVLMQTVDRSGTRRLTTAKDRGRTIHQGMELTDFATEYLMGTAGWRV